MDINSVNSSDQLSQLLTTLNAAQNDMQDPSKIDEKSNNKPSAKAGDSIQMSPFAELMRNGTLSSSDMQQMFDFGKEVFDSVQNGTFDANALAADAPDALKQLASKNGMSVTDLLKQMKSDIQTRMQGKAMHMGYAPPKPASNGTDPAVDPLTGQLIDPSTGLPIDPATGLPIDSEAAGETSGAPDGDGDAS